MWWFAPAAALYRRQERTINTGVGRTAVQKCSRGVVHAKKQQNRWKNDSFILFKIRNVRYIGHPDKKRKLHNFICNIHILDIKFFSYFSFHSKCKYRMCDVSYPKLFHVFGRGISPNTPYIGIGWFVSDDIGIGWYRYRKILVLDNISIGWYWYPKILVSNDISIEK